MSPRRSTRSRRTPAIRRPRPGPSSRTPTPPIPDTLAMSPECARTTTGRTRCARPPGPGRHGLPATPGKAAWSPADTPSGAWRARTVAGRDTGEVPKGSPARIALSRCTQPVRQRVDLAGSGYGLLSPTPAGATAAWGRCRSARPAFDPGPAVVAVGTGDQEDLAHEDPVAPTRSAWPVETATSCWRASSARTWSIFSVTTPIVSGPRKSRTGKAPPPMASTMTAAPFTGSPGCWWLKPAVSVRRRGRPVRACRGNARAHRSRCPGGRRAGARGAGCGSLRGLGGIRTRGGLGRADQGPGEGKPSPPGVRESVLRRSGRRSFYGRDIPREGGGERPGGGARSPGRLASIPGAGTGHP